MPQKRLVLPAVVAIALLTASMPLTGQTIAGFHVNGKLVSRGDTINVCLGNTLIFQSVAQNASTTHWRINNGTPAINTGPGPNFAYFNKVGIDSAIQWVASGNSSDSTYIIIRVSDTRPGAEFTAAPTSLCADIPVQFTNLSTGNGLTYEWNFDDGSKSTLTNPSHQFLKAVGTGGFQSYNVSLTVTNPEGCATIVNHTVTVKKVPDASLGVNDASVDVGPLFNGLPTIKRCSNLPFYTFNFTNASTTTSINTSYSIEWGNGTDTTFTSWPAGVIIPHTYPLGSDTLTVRVTGADGCIGIKKYYVFLGSTPSGGLASLGNEDICSDDSLRFSITPVPGNPNPPGTEYNFVVNDFTPPQVFQHPAPAVVGHYFNHGSCGNISNDGKNTYNNAYGAYLTIQNACGAKSFAVVPIYVSGKPRASFKVSPSETICVNSIVNIQSTAAYGSVITSSNPLCTNSGKQVWAISPATGYAITGGNTGSLNGNPANGEAWTNGTQSLNVQFTATGTYTVKQYVFNNRCGMDSIYRVICVRNPPQASFTMSEKSSCGKGSSTFTNTSPANSCQGDEYQWKVTYTNPLGCGTAQPVTYQFINGSTAATASPEIEFSVPGRYIIRLTVTAKDAGVGCQSSYKEDSFFVKGPPKVAINPISSICVNNSITATATAGTCYSAGPLEYEWTFNNGDPATANSPVSPAITYTSAGTFPVQLTVKDLDCNTSTTATGNVSVASPPAVDAGIDKAICSGESVTIGVAGTSGVAYKWSPVIGVSNSAAANPSVTLSYTGTNSDTTYGFKLTASVGANCLNEDSVYITVKRKPSVVINPVNPQLCIGTSITLTASGADSYQWAPAASLDNTNTGTVIASPAVNTTYTLVAGLLNGCSATLQVPVKVNPDTKAEFTATGITKCMGVRLDTVIKAIPHPGANSVYNWYANGVLIGSNATGAFPVYPINSPGQTVVIKLVTQSAFGCKADSMEKSFFTIPAVTAQFAKSTGTGCGPLKVYFNNTSNLLSNIKFFWNFGNGKASTLAQPDSITFNSHLFNRDTTYYISLKAYNGCDTTYYRDSVKVFANSRAAFNVNKNIACSPFRAIITNLSLGNNFIYYWDYDDGTFDTTYTTGSLKHTFYTGAIDTFRVHLTAVNQCGSHADSIDVVVSPGTIDPQIDINGNSLVGCAPHTTTFINHTFSAALLIVNYHDGSKPDTIPGSQNQFNHRFNNPGIYNISIQLLNNCTDTTITRQVAIFAPPVPSFSISKTLLCTGTTIQTTNTSQNANSYVWDWGDGTTSTGFNAAHTYTAAGVYAVRLSATLVNNFGTVCHISSAPVTVTVVDLVTAQIDTGAAKPCASYYLNVTAAGAQSAKKVEWIFYDSSRAPGIFHAAGISASYQYNTPGQYAVKLIVENTAGCKDSITHHFKVFATPRIEATPFMVNTCRMDTVLNLAVNSTYTGTDALKYKWLLNDELATTGNPLNYRLQVPAGISTVTTYVIKAIAENTAGCSDTALAGTINVRPLLKPGIQVLPCPIIYQPDYTFSFTDSVSTSISRNYLWSYGDGRPPGTKKEVTHLYGDTGTYSVKLQVFDEVTGCIENDTTKVTIVYVPGYLYVPNAICPGCGKLSLRSFLPQGRGLKDYRLRIFNALGQKIFETTSLDVNGCPNEPWNARWDGKIIQQDSYGWQIEAHYINGTEWKGMLYPGTTRYTKTGFITVIK